MILSVTIVISSVVQTQIRKLIQTQFAFIDGAIAQHCFESGAPLTSLGEQLAALIDVCFVFFGFFWVFFQFRIANCTSGIKKSKCNHKSKPKSEQNDPFALKNPGKHYPVPGAKKIKIAHVVGGAVMGGAGGVSVGGGAGAAGVFGGIMGGAVGMGGVVPGNGGAHGIAGGNNGIGGGGQVGNAGHAGNGMGGVGMGGGGIMGGLNLGDEDEGGDE